MPDSFDEHGRAMKVSAFLAVILATAFSSLADTSSLENFSPHLSTNTPIIWQAQTNNPPKSFWIYRRLGPQIFSATVISNAIVLGSLQNKGFPKPSTHDFFISEDKGPNYPGSSRTIFEISPGHASMFYTMPNSSAGSGKEIPSDETIVMRAWKYAFQLGLDPKQLVQKPLTFHVCGFDENGRDATNQICGRSVYLSRQLDGICFWGNGDDGPNEGFWLEIGSHGIIRSFSLNWPSLERDKSHQTASPQQIIACIRAHKIIVLPNTDEEMYFQRVKALANAKKFTITKITPYYSEGVYGEVPTNNEPAKVVSPISELEAVADFGNSNAAVRLIAPILSSEVNRLLGK